jgi:TatD DNase family protein
MHYIDIHTHYSDVSPGSTAIVNVSSDFVHIAATGHFSAGLHPWYLNEENTPSQFKELETAAEYPNLLAIGECGLDKVCDTGMEQQQLWFVRQIRLAEHVHKPLIIHCVRAFEETLKILKDHPAGVPVIFHGFNKSSELAVRILAAGHYLSFGHHLQQERTAAVFSKIPLERVFLETDDSGHSISYIYRLAANIRCMELSELADRITRNAVTVFGTAILEKS